MGGGVGCRRDDIKMYSCTRNLSLFNWLVESKPQRQGRRVLLRLEDKRQKTGMRAYRWGCCGRNLLFFGGLHL